MYLRATVPRREIRRRLPAGPPTGVNAPGQFARLRHSPTYFDRFNNFTRETVSLEGVIPPVSELTSLYSSELSLSENSRRPPPSRRTASERRANRRNRTAARVGTDSRSRAPVAHRTERRRREGERSGGLAGQLCAAPFAPGRGTVRFGHHATICLAGAIGCIGTFGDSPTDDRLARFASHPPTASNVTHST